MEWTAMEEDLAAENGTCMMGISMDLSAEAYPTLQPSRATDKDGLMILVHLRKENQDVFSPFYAFTWQLWLTFLGTAFFVGLVTWLYDTCMFSLQGESPKDKADEAQVPRSKDADESGGKGSTKGDAGWAGREVMAAAAPPKAQGRSLGAGGCKSLGLERTLSSALVSVVWCCVERAGQWQGARCECMCVQSSVTISTNCTLPHQQQTRACVARSSKWSISQTLQPLCRCQPRSCCGAGVC